MRKVLLALLFVVTLTVTASADVIWGPVVYVAWALRYWYVILLVAAVVVVTAILIRKLKK